MPEEAESRLIIKSYLLSTSTPTPSIVIGQYSESDFSMDWGEKYGVRAKNVVVQLAYMYHKNLWLIHGDRF